ncbi:hypothetical protein [Pedobacter sp. UBA5917]|jgi:hypothetical protein|uniref:hypothetical protein n=1 Tax=Pedobacter sp. UBA5917 TaxID=1947061 RepID=UPI0025F9D584|nr:hypothetical protein [Pedobacter sp. UBA5917]
MITELKTIGGKPLSRFYKLPFAKGSRILTLQVLEMHTAFRVRKNPNLLAMASLSFNVGMLTISVKLDKEEPAKVYLFVAYDCLLVSCSIDTDETYLSYCAYRALRAMMWNGCHDFDEYYWPECFNVDTEQSEYIAVINSGNRLKVALKEKFKGFYKPDDYFPEVVERVVVPRAAVVGKQLITNVDSVGIGYCFANTDLVKFHTNHYPFLVPYLFTLNNDGKRFKQYNGFVFNAHDIGGINLSPQQLMLNDICFAMKKIALIHRNKHDDLPETLLEINLFNNANELELFYLWNRALPLLVQQPFTHYLYSFGMRNIAGKPMKKNMEPLAFSLTVPVLSFVLTDKGNYYEFLLRLKVNGKVLQLSKSDVALFMVRDKAKPNLWYLLGAEMDYRLMCFFSRVNFRMQVPKGYYKAFFERYVEGLERFYEVRRM